MYPKLPSLSKTHLLIKPRHPYLPQTDSKVGTAHAPIRRAARCLVERTRDQPTIPGTPPDKVPSGTMRYPRRNEPHCQENR